MFARIFKVRTAALGFVWALLAAPLIVGLYVYAAATSNANTEATYDLQPVINSQTVPPLVMLVMSRDEQLYNKAYSDYTDLNGDGIIDATYNNAFVYGGYFGSDLCYSYNGVYKADNAATNHQCSGEWSGNFLNWLTMSRLDVVRQVLYGGLRTTDTATQTVLQRAAIPNDLHAWVKVYNNADADLYTPFDSSASPVSFCNTSDYNPVNGKPSSGPLIRVAQGNWSEWSATERQQCRWNDDYANANNAPKSDGLGLQEYTVLVDVCDNTPASGLQEPSCRKYTDTIGVDHYKPAGLLQQYGETDKMRFGLMTGSYSDPRSGGRLRRNIGLFAGNGGNPAACVAGDEVELDNGTFCNQTAGTEGIVNTLNQFELLGWQPPTGWAGGDGGVDNDNCYAWGGRARNGNGGTWVLDNPGGGDRHCSAWGNPLSEIYAEALRYIEGNGSGPTAAFVNGKDQDYLPSIPDKIAWKDPYRDPTNKADPGNPYCASCSILVLSTGLNSFDSDEIPADGAGIDALTATDEVGDDEGITNGSFLIGRVLGKLTDNGTISPASLALGASIDTNADACTAKVIDKLSDAIGICPDVPSLEGSYDIAGLAFKAWASNIDLRPDLVNSQNKPATFLNHVQTYTVALAESLPSFNIPVGANTINFSPFCQSNTNGGAQIASPNWSICDLGAVEVGTRTAIVGTNYVYGRPLLPDNSAGSYSFTWEDSTFGSDHDLDSTDVLTWCVGAQCSYQSAQTQAGTRKNLDGSTFTGYDICWRSDHNAANPDYSPACAASGDKPNVPANQVLVRVETTSTAGGYAMLEGYNITGTTTDGVVRTELAPGSFCSIMTGQVDPSCGWYQPVVQSFTVGNSPVQRLQNPLYYAAKYGGFQDSNANGKPDLTSEWDAINNETGATIPDGLPDNFFPVHNPSLLATELGNALNAIIKRTGSGTAAAVVSNSINGDGVVYRALYQPETQDAKLNKVFWTGTLDALWTDSFGLLREDKNGNAQLDDYDVDPIVVFFTDANNVSKFNECQPNDPTKFVPSKFDPNNLAGTCPNNNGRLDQDLDNLKTVWDAQQHLWDSSGAFAKGITSQRTPYSANSDTGRYIFTWIDKKHDGLVDSGEQTDFVWSNNTGTCATGFCGIDNGGGTVSGDFGFLNTAKPTEAECIVDWVRGEESDATNKCGLRSRTIDGTAFGGSPGNVVTRLGDIIDSTPLVVGRPAEAYDLLYGDNSFAAFKSYYRDRRQVAYVGANDGMLHAFNGGFFDAADHKLTLSGPVGAYTASATQHPLGGEIWAYIPGNLLPHLRWLTDPQYQAEHVFYVDGNAVATDAKVFSDDSDPLNPSGAPCANTAAGAQCHPGGWGTILVVPFRLGGGMITVPTPLADDGTAYDPANCKPAVCVKQTSYSAYVVLDVTDPEQPPTVLAELHPASDDGDGQSFTTSVPAFAVMRNPSSGTPNKFFLFIGSGPTGADNSGVSSAVTSTAPLRLYAYDMGCFTGQSGGCSATAPIRSFDLSNAGAVGEAKNSFAGDLIASDFDLDAQAEAVYFGSVRDPGKGGSPVEFEGSLWKLALDENTDQATWKTELMYDAQKPVLARPTIALNNRGAPEVYIGTGRLLSKDDLSTTTQQQIVGMIDPDPGVLPAGDAQSDFTLPFNKNGSDFEDVTNVMVCGDTTGKLCTLNTVTGDPSGAKTFSDLEILFDKSKANGGKAGFFLNLTAPGTSPAERVVSAQALLGGILITNAFTPGMGVCNNVGTGVEFAMNYRTGTGDPSFIPSDGSGTGFGMNAGGMVNVSTSLGAGLPASPSLHVGTGTGNRELTACTQTSTGTIICEKISTLSGVLSREVSWREPLDQ